MRKSVLFLALVSLLFASCRTRVEYETNAGLSLQLSTEGEFTQPIHTKAVDDVKVDINEFNLSITKSSNNEVVLSDVYGHLPSVISIEPGVYNLKAVSPSTKPVAWLQPIYEGSTKNISVSAGKSTNVSIVCKLVNMKVTVMVTDRFVSEMEPDFEITVENADGFLIWNKNAIDLGNSGYYSVKPLTLDIKAKRKTTGNNISHHLDIPNVAAQDHHILTIDASETGDIEFGDSGIKVDYTVNNKEQNIVVDSLVETPLEPLDPVIPGPTEPEPGEPTDPTPGEPTEPNQPVEPEPEYIFIECPGVDEPAVFTATDLKEDVEFTFKANAEKGIGSLIMNVESQNLKDMLAGLPNGSSLAPVDLASMEDPQLGFWGGLFGITEPEKQIKGQTEYSLQVGKFIPMMATVGGDGTYKMSVNVCDNEGHSKKVDITIIINTTPIE